MCPNPSNPRPINTRHTQPLNPPTPQINYTWQSLTLEGSPFKSDKTMTYLRDKITAFSSLSSGSSIDDLS